MGNFEIERTDEYLIKTEDDLGEMANDQFSDLKVVEIPDYVKWGIEEYVGDE